MNGENLKQIAAHFDTYSSIEPYGDGHINDTYVAFSQKRYILQKINTNIFTNPEQVMHNIHLVTEHIKKKLEKSGKYRSGSVLSLIPTVDGKSFYRSENGSCYRMYEFIENASSYSHSDSVDVLYNAAKGFGNFFALLSDFDASQLYETIENFHFTPMRYTAFEKAVKEDKCGRAKLAGEEINAIVSRREIADVVTKLLGSNDIPLRVTHNDTKLNNIMLDNKTGEPVCIIDLDTVMPGSILYDFGDSIRFGASSAAEDEQDLSKVYCDMELFEAFTRGFLEQTGKFLTSKEKELLAFSAKLLTYECGMRFLTDYLNGDTYFKIHFENQNLYRARTQIKLVSDMEKKADIMQEIVMKYAG